jgi:mRNA interferase MazF
MAPLRGEVWVVDLNPTMGHELQKQRPCVVISENAVNTKLGISIVVPLSSARITSKSGQLSPVLVEINPPDGGVSNTCYSQAFQVRTVSHRRFKTRCGTLSQSKLDDVVLTVQRIIS